MQMKRVIAACLAGTLLDSFFVVLLEAALLNYISFSIAHLFDARL